MTGVSLWRCRLPLQRRGTFGLGRIETVTVTATSSTAREMSATAAIFATR